MRCPIVLKRLLHLWEEYSKDGYILGLSYINRQRPWFESIPWFILLVASVPMTGYFVIDIVDDWRNNHVQITMKSMSYPVQEIPFPTLTVCPQGYNINGYNQRYTNLKSWVQILLHRICTLEAYFVL
jgi:amiloride-sensitive sodium channel